MIESRYGHTATLLIDGTVLIAGGIGNGPVLASAERYDPDRGVWSAAGDMQHGRTAQTASLLPDGTVLVAGGSASTTEGVELASAELFDPSTETSTTAGNLNEARANHTATGLTNGAVLVAGGFGAGAMLASAELYDPGVGPGPPLAA